MTIGISLNLGGKGMGGREVVLLVEESGGGGGKKKEEGGGRVESEGAMEITLTASSLPAQPPSPSSSSSPQKGRESMKINYPFRVIKPPSWPTIGNPNRGKTMKIFFPIGV